MKGFIGDIEALTIANAHFRRVLYTGRNLQLVLMTLQPGEEIGEEVHDDRVVVGHRAAHAVDPDLAPPLLHAEELVAIVVPSTCSGGP